MARHRPKPPLSGWYAISLRPQNLHAGVRRAATVLGARCFAVSTLRLVASDDAAALLRALACDVLVATSPAAARFADALAPLRAASGKSWFAVGSGTAAALRRRGIARVHVPLQGSDSEALLAHPGLQQLKGRHVGLLTAPGGRGLIEKALRARGAELVLAQVYARQPCRLRTARLRALAALPRRSALLVSSTEALQSLWRQLDEKQQNELRQRPAIASSTRLAGQLRELGFLKLGIADDARPTSLLAALARDVGAGRFR